VQIERIDSPKEFFAVAGPFLERDEPRHNLLLGFRARLEADPAFFGGAPRLFLVRGGDGEIVAVATQTPPFGVVLSEMDEAAAVALAERYVGDGLDLPTVLGPVARSRAFAVRWCELTGGSYEVGIEERIYAATEVDAPDVPGSLRPYAPDDRALLVEWIQAFFDEAMPGSIEGDPERFATERGADMWFWEVDGEAVSFAGHAGETPNGARVGPVYTPPALRGRGYGSAVTAALTTHLLATRRFCFLFTNLANPTSNSIYQRIGYRPVSDVTVWNLRLPER
jgi:GNAT superfamily N-acetyltransferase